jgi:hypothetical protein
MASLSTCHACGGFVADLEHECPHCAAPPVRRRALWRALALRLVGAASAVTLMACYGATYDCYDDNCYPTYCTADNQCSQGEYCALTPDLLGECTWSGTCYDDDGCIDGWRCDLPRSTCVPGEAPPQCTSHWDCLVPYERCDVTSVCVASVPCDYDGALCGEGWRCEEFASTCVPCAGAACGACTGDVTCTDTAPACPEGTQPAIADGCYTASCIPTATCTAEACALHTDEASCSADPACAATYRGVNCTGPDGGECTPETPCTCESYELECVPAAVAPGRSG